MCDVATALAVASSVFQYSAQNQAAQAQMDAAAESEMLMRKQVAEQQRQINQQSSLEQSERIKQGMVERAQIATIAGESGALGFSSDRLLGDSFMQQGQDISSMELNRINNIKQAGMTNEQAALNTRNANTKARASAGSLIGTGLQIGSDIYKIRTATNEATRRKAGVTAIGMPMPSPTVRT